MISDPARQDAIDTHEGAGQASNPTPQRATVSGVLESEGYLSVFLLEPSPPAGLPEVPTWHPMLDDGATMLAGGAWFVGPPVVSAKRCALPSADAADVFEFVKAALQCGSVPAVVLDPNGEMPEVRFYPKGLDAPDDCTVAPVLHDSVELEAILAVVERVCTSELITPDGHVNGVSIWQNRQKFYPDKQAEVRIQSYVKTGLSAAFPTCTINREQPNAMGRLDLEVEEADDALPGRFVRHAVLELKVLRSYGSTGLAVSSREIADMIGEGLVQAASYRDQRQALAGALCCFDMRTAKTGPECFQNS